MAAAAQKETEASIWMDKADKKLKGWFGGNSKFEEAAEMYEKAANCYKIAKKNDEAGAAYAKTADCFLKLDSKHEAATQLVNAANCVQATTPDTAIKYLKQAAELYTDNGRFSIAAKYEKQIAELYEKNLDFDQAVEHYQNAADMFDGENSTSSSNQCLLKVAHFAAQLENYAKAIEVYEKVANKSVDNNLLRFSVKEYFMKAGFCYLASGDVVGAKRALDRYRDMDPSFSTTREGKLLDEITAACEKYDVDAFTNAIVEFDAISKLDSWKTSILLKIKNTIKSVEGGDGGSDLT